MKRVLCIMCDGFEELEAVGTIALLRRANIQVDLCTWNQSCVSGRFDITISNIKDLKQTDIKNYDALFLPGGPHYKELEQNQAVKDIINYFEKTNKYLAAICAAPTILGRMGLLRNRQYTCFTSMNEDFGGFYQDRYVATDDNLITGRSAAAVIDFAFAFIEALCGKEHADQVKQEIYYTK
mgnify:CR=1 FL=1